MLDLKSDSGDVQYGIDPATVTVAEAPAAAPTVGAYVLLDGVKYAVQYITSRGMLDLKSDSGDVQYGVDPATVTVVDAPMEAVAASAQSFHDPSGLLGTSITVWSEGCAWPATIVELDHTTGKNLLRVQYTKSEARDDEWIERWRLKQGSRVEAATEVNARWHQEIGPVASTDGRRRSVTISPPAEEKAGEVPEWRSGVRPKPPSASSVEQVDGAWVTTYKYPESLARSFERSSSLERREIEASRQLARTFDGLSPQQVGQIAASRDVAALVARWQYACAILGHGAAVAPADAWMDEADGAG